MQPKVTIAYQATPGTLLYTGYSKGFRSGDFNEPAKGINRIFEEEVSDSYELGFKTSLFSNKVTLNGAIFTITQDDAQFTQFNVDTFTLENLSIDEVETSGIELELAIKATENFDIKLSAGIVDSEITAFTSRSDLIGKSQFWIPELNYGATLNHYYELTSDWTMIFRAGLQVEGPKIFSINIPDVESSTGTFVNAGIGLKSESLTIQVYVNNLIDERAIEDIFLFGDGVTD